MNIKLWHKNELIKEKEFKLPYPLSDQTKKEDINLYIQHCHYCNKVFISKHKKSLYCSNEHVQYSKRIRKKYQRLQRNINLKIGGTFKFLPLKNGKWYLLPSEKFNRLTVSEKKKLDIKEEKMEGGDISIKTKFKIIKN